MEKLQQKTHNTKMLNKYGTDLTNLAQQVRSFRIVLLHLHFLLIGLYETQNLIFVGFFLYKKKIDPVIGRRTEIERVMQILCKRKKSNPCLLGDPGVGKTVIVEGLAQAIADSKVPFKLCGKKVNYSNHIELPQFLSPYISLLNNKPISFILDFIFILKSIR